MFLSLLVFVIDLLFIKTVVIFYGTYVIIFLFTPATIFRFILRYGFRHVFCNSEEKSVIKYLFLNKNSTII